MWSPGAEIHVGVPNRNIKILFFIYAYIRMFILYKLIPDFTRNVNV